MTRGADLRLDPLTVVARAIGACAVPADKSRRVMYFVGQGGKDPAAPSCASHRPGCAVPEADCVGFALWAYGVDRYQPPTWWNQNSVHADAAGPRRRWRFCSPYEGCLALIRGPIPGDKRVGHIGVVVAAEANRATAIAHCSPRNHARVGQGIATTSVIQAFGTSRPIYFVERA